MTAQSFDLPAPAGYSLAAASRFVLAFPAAQGGSREPALNLAFALDRTWEPVGLRVAGAGEALTVDVVSNPAAATIPAIRQNVVRILSLAGEEAEYAAIGRRDPVVANLQAQYPGLRPVQFASPYEAAAWAIICQRIQSKQAVRIKNGIAADLGSQLKFPDGQVLDAFPGPAELRGVGEVPGLVPRRVEQLRALADAALAGELDAQTLVELPTELALKQLQRLPGIGPFSAELILVRGAGARDVFPQHEAKLARAMTMLYSDNRLLGPDEGSTTDEGDSTDARARLEAIAERWRPYRSWVSVLIRSWFEDEGRHQGTT